MGRLAMEWGFGWRWAVERVSFAAVVLAGFLLGACERVVPTEPPEPEVAPPRLEVAPPLPVAFSATMEIPVPPHSLVNHGAVDWYATGQTVPAPTWVLLRSYGGVAMQYVRGIVTYPCGPDCPVIYNDDPRPDETFTGDGNGSGTLRVNARVRMANGQVRTPLRGPDRGGQVQWLVYMEPGDQVELMRTGLPGYRVCMVMPICGEPHPPAPMYTFAPAAGGSGVAATAVIPLAAVPDRRSVPPGEAVTFTAFALEEARDFEWYYASGGSAGRVRECRGSTTCTVVPRGDGRMVVYAQWALHTLSGYSDSVRVQPDTLELRCKGMAAPGPVTVTRGGRIDCQASASAGGKLDLKGWSFTGGGVTINRPAPDSASPSWEGTMVVSGAVTVSADVNGVAAKKTVSIDVAARSWPRMRLTSPPHDSAHGDLPPVPRADTTPGSLGVIAGDLGDSHLQRTPWQMPFTGKESLIQSGPNAGWWYMREKPSDVYFLVHISAAWQPGNAWYQKQHGPHPYCTQNQVHILELRTRHHEGIGSPIPGDVYAPPYTHFTLAEHWFAHVSDVSRMYEQYILYEPQRDPLSFTYEQRLHVLWSDSVATPHRLFNNALMHTPAGLVPANCTLRP
jgi:hypothetical protein